MKRRSDGSGSAIWQTYIAAPCRCPMARTNSLPRTNERNSRTLKHHTQIPRVLNTPDPVDNRVSGRFGVVL